VCILKFKSTYIKNGYFTCLWGRGSWLRIKISVKIKQVGRAFFINTNTQLNEL